jgi:hypothetical protein
MLEETAFALADSTRVILLELHDHSISIRDELCG